LHVFGADTVIKEDEAAKQAKLLEENFKAENPGAEK